MDTRTIPDWSSLPTDLCVEIGRKLRTRIDTLRFRAVCASFRSSTPLPPQAFSPCTSLSFSPYGNGYPSSLSDELFPFSNLVFSSTEAEHYDVYHLSLFESTVYVFEPVYEIVHPTKTWLATVEHLNSGKVLYNPPVPGYQYLPMVGRIPKSLNLLDYRVKEITKEYKLGSSCGASRDYLSSCRKVVVSSSLLEIDNGFALMLIYGDGKLCIWRNEDKKWSIVENSSNCYFVDIVYHNKKFYALDFSGSVVAVDPRSLNVSKVADPLPSGSYRHFLKMFEDLLLIEINVNSHGKLYSVDGYPSHDLITYKLDEEKCMWVHVTNVLEDKMVFIRPNCSFTILAQEVSGCKRNCVYLTDDVFIRFHSPFGNSSLDAGFFDLENHKAGPISDFPYYSKFLWPPPTWLSRMPTWLVDRSRRRSSHNSTQGAYSGDQQDVGEGAWQVVKSKRALRTQRRG